MRKMVLWAMVGLLLGVWILGATSASQAQDGKKIFMIKCAACHGENGKGDGPLTSNFDPRPRDFALPEFWQGDVDNKISTAVTKGKGQMVPIKLTPNEIKEVAAFIKSAFKK
jgi:mono/diheme cytochrome c family protein